MPFLLDIFIDLINIVLIVLSSLASQLNKMYIFFKQLFYLKRLFRNQYLWKALFNTNLLKLSSFTERCVPARPWGAKRGSLISQFTHREQASEIRIYPLCTLSTSLSFSLRLQFFIFYGCSVKPEAEERTRKRSATHRAGKTRLPESRLSLLHSSRIGPLSLSPFAY